MADLSAWEAYRQKLAGAGTDAQRADIRRAELARLSGGDLAPEDQVLLAMMQRRRGPNVGRRKAYEGPAPGTPPATVQGTLDHIRENPLEAAAMATSPIPVVGDILGAASDAKAVYEDPSLANFGLAALGALPFVPSMAGSIKSVGKLPVRKAKEDLAEVAAANFEFWQPGGNRTVDIGALTGGATDEVTDRDRVRALAEAISGEGGYIERLLIDQNGNVIEGQHRLDALRKLGIQRVPVTVIQDLDSAGRAVREAVRKAGTLRGDQVHYMTNNILDDWREHGAGISEFGYDQPAYETAFRAGVDALLKTMEAAQ